MEVAGKYLLHRERSERTYGQLDDCDLSTELDRESLDVARAIDRVAGLLMYTEIRRNNTYPSRGK